MLTVISQNLTLFPFNHFQRRFLFLLWWCFGWRKTQVLTFACISWLAPHGSLFHCCQFPRPFPTIFGGPENMWSQPKGKWWSCQQKLKCLHTQLIRPLRLSLSSGIEAVVKGRPALIWSLRHRRMGAGSTKCVNFTSAPLWFPKGHRPASLRKHFWRPV